MLEWLGTGILKAIASAIADKVSDWLKMLRGERRAVDIDRAKANEEAAKIQHEADQVVIKGKNRTSDDLFEDLDDGTF